MTTTKPIAVVHGADGNEIQALLAELVAHHCGDLRVVGMIEEDGPEPARGKAGHLRSVPDGRRFDLFQDLGAGAAGCSLLASGVVAAGAHVLAAMQAPCDLVVLNKFGRLEAEEGSGLVDVFGAAILAGVPVLTSVNPKFMAEWEQFASPLFVILPPTVDAVLDWLKRVRQ